MSKTLFVLMRNPLSLIGLMLVALVVFSAVFADFIVPFPEHQGAVVDFLNFNKAPEWPYIFGTDLVGRDLFTRIIYGVPGIADPRHRGAGDCSSGRRRHRSCRRLPRRLDGICADAHHRRVPVYPHHWFLPCR